MANAVSRYKEKRRKLVDDAKAGPCMDCGGVFPIVCMDLDHRDPSTKEFSLAAYGTRGYDAIKAEIAKCDRVCANCHRIRTHGARDTQMTLF
jgi:hypothetical protein